MYKLSFFAALLLLLASCNRGPIVLNDTEQYKRASAEIESGKTYADYTTVEVGSSNAIQPAASEEELNSKMISTADPSEIRKNIKLRNYSPDKISNDTIVQDEENYQRKNRIANRNANTAFVLGLLAFIPLPLIGILGIIAMVFGIKALVEMKEEPLKYKGKGKAIFGISVGALILVLLFIVIAAIALGYL